MKPIALFATMMLMATTACAHTATSEKKAAETEVTNDYNAFPADTIEVMSQAMNRTIKNVVVKPLTYFSHDNNNMRYPVLYLLHGAYGCYSDWSKKADLHRLADQYGVIIVCPDGQDSWYFDSPVDPKMQFETYVSKELVEYIDSHYRTIANRYMRAITGLSMGGHGALFLAFRHPDVFWSCGSMSGNMDITQFPDSWHIKDRLGNYAGNEQRWRDHAVCNLVFIKNNIAMHEQLVEKGIDHDFTVRPGRHSWDYWVNSLDFHLMFFDKAFKHGAELMKQ